ncbi:hypothetical protein BX616_008476 [Lobosporangium transversale]|nr:hypothetical protein BX616_008476 [Lobosporangium transversale]
MTNHLIAVVEAIQRRLPGPRRRQRVILIVLLAVLSLGSVLVMFHEHIPREKNVWRGNTQAFEVEVPPTTWTCTDDGLSEQEKNTEKNRRTRQCIVENLCIDRKGAFIRSTSSFAENMPKVNLMSSDQTSDVFWQPRVERAWRKFIRAHYVNETLFVHATLFRPFGSGPACRLQ